MSSTTHRTLWRAETKSASGQATMPIRISPAIATYVLLSACSLAPDYKVPQTPPVSSYKESGIWTLGTPHDALPRGPWWNLYNDATLNRLEGLIESANP